MAKKFNVTGLCLPEYHYMVDISDKVEEIKTYKKRIGVKEIIVGDKKIIEAVVWWVT